MPPKLTLAPLRGFTTHVYRTVYSHFFGGLDDALAPFIATTAGHRIKASLLKDVLPEKNRELPVTPQLLGKTPDDFIRMAGRLFDFGYETVNWNLGCPAPMVARKGRGSGMLAAPAAMDAFLETVIPAIPGKLSIKTRLGRFSAADAGRLMPIFNKYPLAELIVHPRVGVQMYDGTPDLDTFELMARASEHPVVYNGDIVTLADFQRISARFPAIDRFMIGRGVLINPFLPRQIRDGKRSVTDKVATFKAFHQSLFAAFSEVFSGPGHLVERMIGFWDYFGQSFENSRNVIKKIRKTRHPDNYIDIVNRFLDSEALWRDDL